MTAEGGMLARMLESTRGDRRRALMPARKVKPKPMLPGRKLGPRSGLVRVMFSVKPEHLAALQDEARTRAAERGSGKIDSGEIVREALDAWIAKRR